jgi:hypothetical protein
MRRLGPRTPLLFAVGLLAACDGGTVALVVDVRTDLVPGVEAERVTVALPDDAERRGSDLRAAVAPGEPQRVAEWSALAPRNPRRLVVTAYAPDGREVVSRSAVLDNRTSQAVQVVLTRSCRARRCADGTTCVGGQCVDERCLTGDEPECPGSLCESCQPLSACDDPGCVRGTCLHRARPGACGAGEVCLPADGCVAAPSGDGGLALPDAGGADAARPDASVADAGPSLCRLRPDTCDYLLQDCGPGLSCVPRDVGGEVVPRCVPAGTGMDTACTSAADCAPGWECRSERCVELCCPGNGRTECSVAGTSCLGSPDGLSGWCVPSDCDLGAGGPCPAGEACYLSDASSASCLEEGSGEVGEPCVAQNDCRGGLGCGFDMRCRAYCGPGLPSCAGDERCTEATGFDFGLCQPSGCDPLSGTGCPSGQACYASGPGTSACLPEGSTSIGGSCGSVNECVPGAVCVGTCRPLCDTRSPSCSTGSCTPLSGWEPWGGCV